MVGNLPIIIGIAACFALLAALVVWIIYISGPGLKRRKIVRLGPRPALSPAEFYHNFYAESGLSQLSVIEILNHVANCTSIPPELLRPQDRLEIELAPIKFWELGFDFLELKMALHRAEEKTGIVLDYHSIRTLDDYIRVFGQLRESGVVSPEMIYPRRISMRQAVLVSVTITFGSIAAFLGLSELLDRLRLGHFDWALLSIFVLGYLAKRWWIKRVGRRFEFGK